MWSLFYNCRKPAPSRAWTGDAGKLAGLTLVGRSVSHGTQFLDPNVARSPTFKLILST